MNFRINPKIGGSMKKIHLSPLAGMPLIEYLKQKGFEICFTQALVLMIRLRSFTGMFQGSVLPILQTSPITHAARGVISYII